MSSIRTGDTAADPAPDATSRPAPGAGGGGSMTGRIVAAWAFVGIPLAYGVYETVKKASALF
jgi:hypothetical protein